MLPFIILTFIMRGARNILQVPGSGKPCFPDHSPVLNGYEVLNRLFLTSCSPTIPKVIAFGEDLGKIRGREPGIWPAWQAKHGVERIFDTGIPGKLTIMGQGDRDGFFADSGPLRKFNISTIYYMVFSL